MKLAFCKWRIGHDVLLEGYPEEGSPNPVYEWWHGLYLGFCRGDLAHPD